MPAAKPPAPNVDMSDLKTPLLNPDPSDRLEATTAPVCKALSLYLSQKASASLPPFPVTESPPLGTSNGDSFGGF